MPLHISFNTRTSRTGFVARVWLTFSNSAVETCHARIRRMYVGLTRAVIPVGALIAIGRRSTACVIPVGAWRTGLPKTAALFAIISHSAAISSCSIGWITQESATGTVEPRTAFLGIVGHHIAGTVISCSTFKLLGAAFRTVVSLRTRSSCRIMNRLRGIRRF